MRFFDSVVVAGAGANTVVNSRPRPKREVAVGPGLPPASRLLGLRAGALMVRPTIRLTQARRRALKVATDNREGRWRPRTSGQRTMAEEMAGDGLGLWLPLQQIFQVTPLGRWALMVAQRGSRR